MSILKKYNFKLENLDCANCANKTIEKYESNYGKVLIYLRSLDVMRTNKFKVEFRAVYPVDITGGAIEVYDYYTPESIEYTAPENIKVVD